MNEDDWSPINLLAISYIRVASGDPHDTLCAVERQRAQITAAAQRLGLRLVDEFVDAGCSGMGMDRPGLRRLLDHVATHQVGYCVVATLDRFSRRPEDAAEIDQALSGRPRCDRRRRGALRLWSVLTNAYSSPAHGVAELVPAVIAAASALMLRCSGWTVISTDALTTTPRAAGGTPWGRCCSGRGSTCSHSWHPSNRQPALWH